MKKYFVLTFDLPLFGPSGINNRPSPLLFADINSCQGTHTNTSSGQNIYYPLTQKSFYPVHLSLDISPQWLLVFSVKGIWLDSPISWSSLTLCLSLANACNHLCLSSAFLQQSAHINSRVEAWRKRRAFFRVSPRSASRPSGTSTTSVWSISSRPR